MTGYATAVKNGAAQYAAMYQELATAMGAEAPASEEEVVDQINQEEEPEGLSEEEMNLIEQMAPVHDPDPTAEDGVLDEDDPNVKMILGM